MNWKERRHKRLRKRIRRLDKLTQRDHDIRRAFKGRWKKVFVYLSLLDRGRIYETYERT